MLAIKHAFSGFSVDNLDQAKEFYTQTLGFKVEEETAMGLLRLHLPGNATVMLYPKPHHIPATYTILNLVVDNIDQAVDELTSRGVIFETYQGFEQDKKGIARSKNPQQNPNIAWFKDPAGNVLAVLEN